MNVFLCQVDDQTEAFVFETYSDGTGTLRGYDGSKATRSGSTYSAMMGPTLIQIEGLTIRKVDKGTFSIGTCASADGAVQSIVDSAMSMARRFLLPRPEAAVLESALAAALAARDESESQAASLRAALRAVEAARDAYAGDVEETETELAELRAEVARLRGCAGGKAGGCERLVAELAAVRQEAEELRIIAEEQPELEAELRSALAAKLAAEREARQQTTEAEERQALLLIARHELGESRGQVQSLTEQVSMLRRELGVLQALLDDAEIQNDANQVRIETLNEQLDAALARAAAEEKRRENAPAE